MFLDSATRNTEFQKPSDMVFRQEYEENKVKGLSSKVLKSIFKSTIIIFSLYLLATMSAIKGFGEIEIISP